MALATRCPACGTVFRISTTQAAAKGGRVRCGHCLHAFDALDARVRAEDVDAPDERPVEVPAPPTDPVERPSGAEAIVLTDVQDRPILRRALRPEDYLSLDRQTDRSARPALAAAGELPVRVVFELRDLRFTGYRLDRFYP